MCCTITHQRFVKTTPKPRATKKRRGELELLPPPPPPPPPGFPVGVWLGLDDVVSDDVDILTLFI
jgi:hypothetical protein